MCTFVKGHLSYIIAPSPWTISLGRSKKLSRVEKSCMRPYGASEDKSLLYKSEGRRWPIKITKKFPFPEGSYAHVAQSASVLPTVTDRYIAVTYEILASPRKEGHDLM